MLARNVLANAIRRELARKCLQARCARGFDWRGVGEIAGCCTIDEPCVPRLSPETHRKAHKAPNGDHLRERWTRI